MKKHRRNHRKSRGRIVVFILLMVGIIVASTLLVLKLRERTEPSSSTPTQNATPSTTPEVTPQVDAALEGKISDWAKNQPGDYGVVVREVSAPLRTASYQGDKSFVAASTYKLFLTATVLSAVEKGQLSLTTPVVSNKDITACLDSLLIYSQEECAWPMGNLLGWPTVQSTIASQGFKATDINNYDARGNFVGNKTTSAADQAELLWRLQAGTLLNPANTDLMLSRMKQQKWRERIPAGVPTGVVVADKPGWLDNIENDTAIVYGPKSTYVVSILSTGSAPADLAELSKIIYDHLNQ